MFQSDMSVKMRSIASSSSSPKGVAAIVGVGPKLGRSIARKFANEGYTVAILAQDLDRLSRFAEEIAGVKHGQVYAIRMDCSDKTSIKEAFEAIYSLGFVEVLVYNACQVSSSNPTSFTDIRIEAFERSMAVNTVGAFHCAQKVIPSMMEKGKGTIIFTGCSHSLTGTAGFSELCCGKFALRALSQCLAKEFQPLGIHVAHVIIDGNIGASRAFPSNERELLFLREADNYIDPDGLAQTYWHLHVQDRTAWSQEIDVRPYNRRYI